MAAVMPIGNEAAGVGPSRLSAHCWQPVLRCELHELWSVECGEAAMKDDKGSGALLLHCGVGTRKLARIFYRQRLNLNFQSPGRSLRLFQFFVIPPPPPPPPPPNRP